MILKQNFIHNSDVDLLDFKQETETSEEPEGVGITSTDREILESDSKEIIQIREQIKILSNELTLLKRKVENLEAEDFKMEGKITKNYLPKRAPISRDIYKLLIKHSKGSTYNSRRTRVGICLLVVTGLPLIELLELRVSTVQTFLEEGSILIQNTRAGSEHKKIKVSLSAEGKKVIEDRKKDFNSLFYNKTLDSYIFTSSRAPYQRLRRETLTIDINKVTRSVSESLPDQPNITTRSLRIGYTNHLWENPKLVKFVRWELREQIHFLSIDRQIN